MFKPTAHRSRTPLLTTTAAAVALSLGAAGTSFAKGPGTRGGHQPEQRMARMLDAVDATQAQRDQIASIHDTLKPQVQSLREQMKTARQTIRQASPQDRGYQTLVNQQAEIIGRLTSDMVKLKTSGRTQTLSVLTAEQRDQLMQARAERRDRSRTRRAE